MVRRLSDHQHLLVILVSAWLILTSPWVGMLGRLPRQPSAFDYAHVFVGWAALFLGATYFLQCVSGGGWRLSFPWLSGQWRVVVADLGGLLRGRISAAESGGLFGAIGGLALVAFLATAITGAAWWWTQGTSFALDWRAQHLLCVRVLIVMIVFHAVTAALHILDFVRD